MLSAAGVGSGLDINSIISQLMSLERRPLQRMQQQESQFNAQLSAYGQLRSAVASFETAMAGLDGADNYKIFSPTSSDETVATATADSTANNGSYDLDVALLALQHKTKSADATYTASTDVVSADGGTMHIDVGGTNFDVAISAGATLSDVRDAINSATDNAGVTATIINGSGTTNLVLTADNSGASSAVTVTTTDGDSNDIDASGLSNLASVNLVEIDPAQDASFTIDGIAATSSSNTVTGVVSGVTFELLKDLGATATITVQRDTAAITESVEAFADTFNSLRSTIKTLHAEGATLESDNTLLTLDRQIMSVLNTPAAGLNYGYLSEIGLSLDKEGVMSVDTTALTSALDANFDDVANLFSDSTEGFAVRMQAMAADLQQADGLLDSREDGLNDRISASQDRQEIKEYNLVQIEARLRKQYSALDAMLGSMQAQSSYLSQQLGNLPGFTRK